MIIAITAKGKTLDGEVDPRFGRCQYFLVVDTETLKAEAIENPNLALGGGAGIQSAQLMAEHDVKAVLTGNCGPNAYQTLNAAEIEVIVGANGRIRDVVEQFKSRALSSTQGPNVASHFGAGADIGGRVSQDSTFMEREGAVMGRGMGSGGGGGRGMGRGMGMGLGRGMGGAGGIRTSVVPSPVPSEAGFPAGAQTGSEIDVLKAEAQDLEAQLQSINSRLEQIQSGRTQGHLVAVVNRERCTGCGLCAVVCPVDAIMVHGVAIIDASLCTGCGECVPECPEEAITLKRG